MTILTTSEAWAEERARIALRQSRTKDTVTSDFRSWWLVAAAVVLVVVAVGWWGL